MPPPRGRVSVRPRGRETAGGGPESRLREARLGSGPTRPPRLRLDGLLPRDDEEGEEEAVFKAAG